MEPKKKYSLRKRAASESGQKQRLSYWEEVKQIKPENLVFLDEMGTRVGLTREVGRSYGGQRLYDTGGIYRGKNVTSVGAISLNKV